MGDDTISSLMSSLNFVQNPIATVTETSLEAKSQAATGSDEKTIFSKELHGRSLPGFSTLKTVEDLVTSLARLGIPGPLSLYSHFNEEAKLGQGAQFLVTSGEVLNSDNCEWEVHLDSVAVKRPLFRFDEEGSLDLASSRSRQQIHDMYLEIVALRHESLRNHRNIVRSFGWATDGTWYQLPLLVLELAFADLRAVFERTPLNYNIIHQLGIDVGHGIDAIHGAGIVHGDLKPQNVLVFANDSSEVPFTAKLADFGLSVDSNDTSVDIIGMSSEWCAPEIRAGANLNSLQLMKADNFSYGMVLWSISCFKGLAPGSKDVKEVVRSVESGKDIPQALALPLVSSLSTLLLECATSRPLEVGELLKDKSRTVELWDNDEQSRCKNLDINALKQTLSFSWELVSVEAFFFQGLETSFLRQKATLTASQLLSIFLALTYQSRGAPNQALQLEVLQAAIDKGSVPAMAIMYKVCDSYSRPCAYSESLLQEAAATGSLLARNDLHNICPIQAQRAWTKFHERQGYNQFYSPTRTLEPFQAKALEEDENSYLHVMAAHGAYQRLEQVLQNDILETEINKRNKFGETALYKACLAGCWRSVSVLCQHGADASIPTKLNQLTCLHWLFNFSPDEIPQVINALLKAKAKINALANPASWTPTYHFPFSWPPGAPLHWAVFSACPTAIAGLLQHGADPNLRDGRDPYIADENVRQMHRHGNLETGEFSQPDRDPLGFSVLDLAASLHDVRAVRLIRLSSTRQILLQEDEEGYTPIHRLSYMRMCCDSNGLRFWFPSFAGTPTERTGRTIETIQELQDLGIDIDRVTKIPSRPGRSEASGLTPLMIAVTESDNVAAAALLHCGANPNLMNHDSSTALTLIPEGGTYDPAGLLEAVKLCVKYRGNVNHRSKSNTTPLRAAIMNGSMSMIGHLLEAGAEINMTAQGLHLMAQLIFYKSLIRSADQKDDISYAEAEARDFYFVQLMNSTGTDLKSWAAVVDKDNGSLLHYAVRSGLIKCVGALLAAGLEVNQIRKLHFNGRPPPGYSSVATFLGDGTALDVLNHAMNSFIETGLQHCSVANARFTLDQYEAVRRALIDYKAVKANELIR